MKRYTILRHPDFGYVEANPEGWSWNAFWLAHLWALYHHLWQFFFILCGVEWIGSIIAAQFKDYLLLRFGMGISGDEIAYMMLDFKIDIFLSTLALIPVLAVGGAYGNRMRLRKWQKQGYEIVSRSFEARSQAAAVLSETRKKIGNV